VLVSRGNREVMHTLATNSGAAFSQTGYSTLVKRAENDDGLIEKLGRRIDIPLQFLRELVSKATEAVRQRLLASVGADKQDLIRQVLTEVSSDIVREAPKPRDFTDATRLVALLKETNRLNEAEIHVFAKHEKYEETIAGIAALCGVPVDLIERLAQNERADSLLIPCKAAGLGWLTVRAILDLRGRHNALAQHDFETAEAEFAKLSKPTAARVLRFWQVRQMATNEPVGE